MATLKVFICVAVSMAINASAMDISLASSGNAVIGSNITFTATVSDYSGQAIRFDFYDNASPQHKASIEQSTNVMRWVVEYPKNEYEPRDYTVTVNLMRDIFGIWVRETWATTTFQLTKNLNGDLILNQNNKDLQNSFVAVNKTVHHYIKLPKNDLIFLENNASSIATHWFIDCKPYGSTNDFSFNFTYDDNMNDHHIEAIIIANNEPLPPLTTTTTTTTTTSTTTLKPPPTTTKPPLTTIKPPTRSEAKPTTDKIPITTDSMPITDKIPTTTDKIPTITNKLPVTGDKMVTATDKTSYTTDKLPATDVQLMATKQQLVNTNQTDTFSMHKLEETNKSRTKRSASNNFTCNNSVPIGKKDTYGRYEAKVSVREPISSINITGLDWLKHGDLLNLDVAYTGSPPFNYCILYKVGQYNVTGNETCAVKTPTISNSFPLVHYFPDSDQHTVVIVVENDIGKNVARSTITIYKTTVHAQLSVIMVPLIFSLVAVILVVFGIAYYQHRSTHTVEVADFDFGQAHPDFKTFRERLRDSFKNAFNFRNRDDTDPLTSNNRYDPM